MKRAVVLLILLSSCKLFDPKTPSVSTEYGKELKVCEDTAKTWADYEACCIGVAGKYGRDSNFCRDGGDS